MYAHIDVRKYFHVYIYILYVYIYISMLSRQAAIVPWIAQQHPWTMSWSNVPWMGHGSGAEMYGKMQEAGVWICFGISNGPAVQF